MGWAAAQGTKEAGRGEQANLILSRNAGGRVGGEGRCLAAEVRPYLELAECLSPSRVRAEGGGERWGAERERRGGSCWEEGEPSLSGKELHLCQGPGKAHRPFH